MSDTIIRVENLSKKYVLSHQQEGQQYKALRDVIAEGAKAVGKKLLKPSTAIAHRLSTIMRADKVVVMEQGRIIEQGTYQELLTLRGKLWKYHQMQHEAS